MEALGQFENMVEQTLTIHDGIKYIKTVKNTYQDKCEIYEEFLQAMNDFKAQRIDVIGLRLRVKELFKDQKELILGFDAFLPKGFEITEVNQLRPNDFKKAISLINKIKKRFHGDDHSYKSFVDILHSYKKGQYSISYVYHEVAILFRDHHDLFVEFSQFIKI